MSVKLPNETEVPPGPRRELLSHLRALYDAAGRPSTRQISSWTRKDTELAEISPDLVSRALRGSVPRWANLESLVRVLLAHPAIDTLIGTPEEHLRRLHKIWVLADDDGRSAPATTATAGRRREDPRLSALTREALDADVRTVYHELTRLRQGEGLTTSKAGRRSGLLSIGSISKRIAFEPDHPDESVMRLVVDCVRQMPVPEGLVADVVLGLGLHQAEFHSLGERPLYWLYGDSLGRRREVLLSHWRRLHEALGVKEVPPTPSDRRLRGVVEEKILWDLAGRMIRPSGYWGPLDPESSPGHEPSGEGET